MMDARNDERDDEHSGMWLGYVLCALLGFLALMLVIWIGSHLALSIDLSALTIHPDCPTEAC